MSVKFDNIVKILKDNYPIFHNVSESSLKESIQVFRIFELRETESIKICGSRITDYILLLTGQVELINTPGKKNILLPENTYKKPLLLQPYPNKITINAIEDSIICHIDCELLDYLIILEESVNYVKESSNISEKYYQIARNSDIFRRIPLENAEYAFKLLKELKVKKGDEIIKVREHGDAFYIIVSGKAELWEIDVDSGFPEKKHELIEGDKFGEGSLLTTFESQTSVKMLEDGVLLSLSRADFLKLLAKPLVPEVEATVAKAMLDSNYFALDVNLDIEYEMEHIPGAKLISLHELRHRIAPSSVGCG